VWLTLLLVSAPGGFMRAMLRCVVAAALICLSPMARAQDTAESISPRGVLMVIGAATASPDDTHARLVARHLPKHLPGKPAVYLRNMPGAGGMIAANFLYANAPKNALTFGLLNSSVLIEGLLGHPDAQFVATRFNWLGSPNYETGALVVRGDTPSGSWREALGREITTGAPGLNSSTTFTSAVLNETLGLNLRIHRGYSGPSDALLAMEREEIDAFPILLSALTRARPEWLAQGKVRALVQLGPRPDPSLKDVGFAPDLVSDPQKKRLLRAAAAPLALGHPFAAPPGMTSEQLTMLRQGLARTFADPAYLAEAAQLGLLLNQPRTASQLHATLDEFSNLPAEMKDQLRRLTRP
jgi:tripartite-type tricarboxylate transporter receptor subunit TctC